MLINRKFGEYVLLQRLAVGGQSEVFLALKVGPGDFLRTVVIKVLPSRLKEDERFVRLFFKEAFVSSRFAHPNVITVYDARLIEGDYCLVMDFVAGQTVADIAQRGFQSGQPLSLNQSIQIIADACDGLHYAHQFRDLDESTYSIVHCDISPQNLMVTYQGVTKVFDFGIAHIPGYEGTNEPLTVGGKYAYMSPEQLRGDEVVDARSDIFSLGIILYELCTGYRLFRRGSQPEVIKAVCEEPIRPPTTLRPDLPMFLERIVMRALERDPRRRYRTAAEMRDDLLQLLSMMSKGSERASLGDYVASLFVDERKDIADVLRQANQGMLQLSEDMSEGFVERLTGDFAPFEEETMELDPEAFKEYAKAKEEAHRAVKEANQKPGEGNKSDGAGDEDRSDSVARQELEQERAAALEHANDLEGEVTRLQRRQTLLMVLILVLGAISIVLGVLQFQAKSGSGAGAGGPDASAEVSSSSNS
jgi:serine/threonine-protein kinase